MLAVNARSAERREFGFGLRRKLHLKQPQPAKCTLRSTTLGDEVEQIEDQKVAGLRAFDRRRPTEIAHARQVHVAGVARAVVGADLPARPVGALTRNGLPGLKEPTNGTS